MSKGAGWDLTSPRSLDAAAEWVRAKSGALLVLVVRADAAAETKDVAFAVDPRIAPKDAAAMVEAAMPEIVAKLDERRRLARDMAAAGKGF